MPNHTPTDTAKTRVGFSAEDLERAHRRNIRWMVVSMTVAFTIFTVVMIINIILILG